MARCRACGMKECCGVDLEPEIAELQAKLAKAREVLSQLVLLKRHKDMFGKVGHYETAMPKAWDAARAALAEIGGSDGT